MRATSSAAEPRRPAGSIMQGGVLIALLLAALGPGYYYGIHLPARERQLDANRLAEVREQADAARTAALLQEKERLLTVGRYQRCLQAAGQAYEAEWARSCAWQAEQAKRTYPACVARGTPKAECAARIQISPDCALARDAAEPVTEHFERQRDRCLDELKAGIRE